MPMAGSDGCGVRQYTVYCLGVYSEPGGIGGEIDRSCVCAVGRARCFANSLSELGVNAALWKKRSA